MQGTSLDMQNTPLQVFNACELCQACAFSDCWAKAARSIQLMPHIWPSGSSKLRPYMKLYSSFGLGSATAPAAAALSTISSTSLRLSADRQNNAWFEVFASEIGFGV